MKIAIIGCGTIANGQHIPAYMKNPKAEIKYFCDIIPQRAEKAVKDNGCGIAVTDYRQVLADPEVTRNTRFGVPWSGQCPAAFSEPKSLS